MSLLPDHRLLVVWATINGSRDFRLAVDTGAERTVISRAAASRLGLDLRRPVRMEALAGVGQSPPVPVVRLERVQVGASVATGLLASVFDLPAVIRTDGLLGLDFLNRFARATVEFDTRTIVLRPRTTQLA